MGTIKRGMAASLVAALILVALDREKGHALMGGLFLGLLSRHLWVLSPTALAIVGSPLR
ncbi:MAG: hypothetical protein U5J62_07035 [Desulfurivibrio sp.]|nr:hypothetical protein [Desulfurivibrio sp.]